MQVEAVLYPGQFGGLSRRDLRGHVAVVFDVLRATSVELTALVNGAERILPVVAIEDAFEVRRNDPGVLLGGERGGVRPDGFDFGNSPLEYGPDRVAGRTICHTTTNGTLAMDACRGSDAVYLGTLLNLAATARHLQSLCPEKVVLVCAGTHSHFALEDGLAAGALVANLLGGHAGLTASARACLSVWRSVEQNPGLGVAASRNAARLRELGLMSDVDYCSRLDVFDCVVRLASGEATLQSS